MNLASKPPSFAVARPRRQQPVTPNRTYKPLHAHLLLAVALAVAFASQRALAEAADSDNRQPGAIVGEPLSGYRGIWHGQEPTGDQYSYKYSGGLATYTAKHIPLAIYAAAADQTFFVYGGTKAPVGAEGDVRDRLLACIGCYNHATGHVLRPTLIHDKQTFDPHDNPALSIDDEGHLWVIISGRGRGRPGWIYRSVEPHAIDKFRLLEVGEFTYPQPWHRQGQGFLFLFTKYLGGRQLFFRMGGGADWSDDRPLAKFGGHYQLSWCDGTRVATAFNWHPRGVVNDRTNLYYLETRDGGATWTTAAGVRVSLPLVQRDNPALIHDYQADGLRVYLNDLKFTAAGEPVIQYVTSRDWQPGPTGDPRTWTIAHFHDGAWQMHAVTTSDHNYDTGLLDVARDTWRIIGPTERGPQSYHTGGEVALWQSDDQGRTWDKVRDLTADSSLNHTYVRPVLHAHDDFFALWADGDPSKPSPCRLYFCNRAADRVWRLPEEMVTSTAPSEAMTLPVVDGR